MTNADHALTKSAAIAAGMTVQLSLGATDGEALFFAAETGKPFSPLTDDGDALRLAVKLGIGVLYSDFVGEAEARWDRGTCRLAEYGPEDPCAATRRAITRAAAAIGGAR